jgi:LPPG:FO 2-phospho-L-lactate transferase
VEVRAVVMGAATARPAPGVVEAIGTADIVLVCPSNPITSVGPILAVPVLLKALRETEATVAAVSPIVGGDAVSGPAGRLMAGAGLPVSAVGVARAYAGWLDLLVFDDRPRPRPRAAGLGITPGRRPDHHVEPRGRDRAGAPHPDSLEAA